MSKQSSTQQHMYLQQAQQAQREIPQKQFVQQRNAGARQISQQQPQQRLTQPAAMMGTSPGQGYPAYSQYTPYQQPQPGPQFMQGHQMLMQPGAPMQMPNTQVRMSQAGGYGYLQQPQASQYAFAPPSPLQMYYSGAQQPGPGVRQAAMSTVSLPQANYMTQPQQQLFMPAAQQPIMPQKRERKVIPIINPNTGQDVLADDSSKNDSSSTPPMSESSSDRSTPDVSHSTAIEIRPPPSVVTTTVSSLSANGDEFRPQANGIAHDTEVSAVDYSGYCDEESAGEMMPDSAEVEAETFEMEDIDEANKVDSLLEPENGPALLVEEEVEFTNITAADKTDIIFVAGILPTSADTEPVANHTGLQSSDKVIETELVPCSKSSAVGDSEEDTCSEVHVAAFAISPSAHPIEPLQSEVETIDALAVDFRVEVAEVLQNTSELNAPSPPLCLAKAPFSQTGAGQSRFAAGSQNLTAMLQLMTDDEKMLPLCIVCHGIVSSPVLLTCLHSACRACIENVRVTGCQGQEAATLECPLCSEMSDISQQTIRHRKDNLHLLQRVAVFKARAEEPVCQACQRNGDDNAAADYRCRECKQFMCDKCLTFHAKILHLHSVQPVDEYLRRREPLPPTLCQEHQLEFDFFCARCCGVKCSKCIRECSKAAHDYSTSDATFVDVAQQLNEALSNLKASQAAFKSKAGENKQLLIDLASSKDVNLKLLESNKRRALDIVTQAYDSARAVVQDQFESSAEKYSKALARAEQLSHTIDYSATYCQSVLNHNDVASLLDQQSLLLPRLKRLVEQAVNVPASFTCDVKMVIGSQQPQTAVEIIQNFVGIPQVVNVEMEA